MNKQYPIGVFDSGVGGLTVVKAIMKMLPSESIIYFGDTARLPYGTKSPSTVIRYSIQIGRFLHSQQVKAIVVACNSASSTALEALQTTFTNIPIIGVIRPGAKHASAQCHSGNIGIIGTKTTISSGAYSKAIKNFLPKALVVSQACPLLVPMIEEGLIDHPATLMMLNEYLEPLTSANIDSLILGCTHYPLLRKQIQHIVGDNVSVIDSATATATELSHLLIENKLAIESNKSPKHRFFLSDLSQPFIEIANNILESNLSGKIQRIDLEEVH